MPDEVQRKGSFKLGPTGSLVDYSNSISSMKVNRTREKVTVPATLGTGRASEKAGAIMETLTITFFSSTAAASVWAELYDAIDTDSAELDFEFVANAGAVGADNPEFSGRIVVMALETGGDVGSLRSQSQTYPVTAAGVAKAVS